ncbi:MAG: serine/threonine protein kinase [Acidobacteriaceae bacterium]|nr:serine/threonine protein kinase [Acidobacteriaceae bacterium]
MDFPLRPEVEVAFAAALEVPEAEQEAFLAREYPQDAVLCAEVQSLLRAYRAIGAFLEPCAHYRGALIKAEAAAPTTFPYSLGRYRILRLLGEGGMGAVYEAEQEHPQRKVAVKVLKNGFTSAELIWRFEHESQALGRLQHPGIAQIYEAGIADSPLGPQPYFAMELIRGQSLLEYAAVHGLNARQRLEIMMKICEAVQHAHQAGVIHRDLKPSNILVEESGQPKILDFGVARTTNRDVQATRHTDVGQLVGTLAYMSPEQVLADPLALDARSDVYALGMILFELLAGQLPYKVGQHLHEAVQTIREQDSMPLSAINRAYRGDLETIASKALEKDKARRYASAADLEADIGRYLHDEPILARPPTVTYQLTKFTRRHRALVVGLAAIFVVLIAGLIASTWEAALARRAEFAALTQAATAKAISDFLENDLLAQASTNVQAGPSTKPDPDLRVRTVLDRAAARISGKFGKQPLVEASIRQTMGNAYGDLGLYSDAQRQIERTLQLRRAVLGGGHRDTLRTMHTLAELYQAQGKYPDAEALYGKVLEAQRQILGEEHPDTIDAMHGLAVLYRNQGRYAQAESLLAKALALQRRVLGEEHPNTLIGMNSLAVLYRRQGKYAQAESLYTKALEIQRRALGGEHPDTLISMNNLAVLYKLQRKYAQAEPLYAKVLAVRRRVLGEEHPSALISMHNLALLYVDQGKYTQAEQLFTKVLEARRRMLGETHPNTLDSMHDLAALYRTQAKYAQALPLFKKALEARRHVLGEEHPDTLETAYNLARLYVEQGKYVQAETLLVKVLDVRRRVLGERHSDTTSVLASLTQLYENWGAPKKAILWRAKLQGLGSAVHPGQ